MTLPLGLQRSAVPTPSALAAAMVQALGDDGAGRWLEPCVGNGVVLYELAAVGIPRHRITAVDLDETTHPNDGLAETHRGKDFLRWAKDSPFKFQRILANPPYISLNKVDQSLACEALNFQLDGFPALTANSNYWCAFLYGSLALLEEGGSLCFVLPAAWEHADYALTLRTLLPQQFSYFETHRCHVPLFDSVQDGCVVILGKGFREPAIRSPRRIEHRNPDALISTLLANRCDLSSDASELHSITPTFLKPDVIVRDVFEIGLGGVTGDSNYFLLTESERVSLGMPISCLRRVVSRARHLQASELTELGWSELHKADERIWLFHPPDELLNTPNVKDYLTLNIEEGGCDRDRFKIKHRNPWFRTILPERADGFLSGMTRLGPWICLSEVNGLTATNTLYVVKFRKPLSRDEMAAWSISFMSSETRSQLHQIGRVYADGLVKFEPGSLMSLKLIQPSRIEGARFWYSRMIGQLVKGELVEAQGMADTWLNTSPQV